MAAAADLRSTAGVGKRNALGGDREQAARPLRFGSLLCLVVLAGTAQRMVLLVDYVVHDPFALQPISDARTYWEWAGRIADGQLLEAEPFLAAPLYAYLIAPLRLAGGGLVAAYAFNAALDLVTTILLASWVRRRTGDLAALLAAGLFLLMLEPAAFSLRTLPISLQMFLVCLAAIALEPTLRCPGIGKGLGAGATLGLLALAYPAAVALVPAVALICCGAARVRGVWPALAILGGGALTIAPAALHNWQASGEFIPVTAHFGITFAHGNNAGAAGTYHPERGVSAARAYQNLDARREVEQSLGRPASWSEVNHFFLRRGLHYWLNHPGQAVQLMLRKLYWFFSGLHYGDIYSPLAERGAGLFRALWLAPVQTAWLIPLALLVALTRWLRFPLRYAPEWLLFLLPLVVALVFFYSPRYRAPLIPVLLVATAEQLVSWWTARRSGWRTVPAAAAAAIGLGLPVLNAASGFDAPAPPPGEFWSDVAHVLQTAGRERDAITAYERGLAFQPCQPRALAALSLLYLDRGLAGPAEAYARQAVECDPNDVRGHNQLAAVLISQERQQEALAHARIAVQIDSFSAAAHTRLAVALVALGRTGEAVAALRRAHELSPRDPVITSNLAWFLATLADLTPADRQAAVPLAEQAVAATQRQSIRPLATLAAAYAATGRFAEAIRALDRALALARSRGDQAEVQALLRQRERYEVERATGRD